MLTFCKWTTNNCWYRLFTSSFTNSSKWTKRWGYCVTELLGCMTCKFNSCIPRHVSSPRVKGKFNEDHHGQSFQSKAFLGQRDVRESSEPKASTMALCSARLPMQQVYIRWSFTRHISANVCVWTAILKNASNWNLHVNYLPLWKNKTQKAMASPVAYTQFICLFTQSNNQRIYPIIHFSTYTVYFSLLYQSIRIFVSISESILLGIIYMSSTSPSIHPLSVYASIHTNTHSLSSVYKYLSAHPPSPFLVYSFLYQSTYISVIYAAILPFLHPSLFSTSTTTHLPLSLSLSPVEQVCNGTRDKNTPAFLTSTY